jgi:hypothetical protein
MFPYDDLSSLIEDGQEYLAESIKLLIYQSDSELFERLDFNDDRIFLEPFLFSYFTAKTKLPIGLHQLLFGYLEKENRYESTAVFADEQGVIYMPNIGYFFTTLENETVQLSYVQNTEKFELWTDDRQIDFEFQPPLMIPGTSIELYKYSNPFFRPYFAEWNEEKKDFENYGAAVEITKTTELHFSNLIKAFELLKTYSPEQFIQYTSTTQRIVIFHNSKIRNFAVREMHGTAFISANPDDSEIFFLEEIIHQCSHNVFNAITANLSGHFLIDAETPLKKYSKSESEFRSIYSALHGLYTVATRMACFHNCMDGLEGNRLHEVIGRFADLRMRFRNGLDKLHYEEVFTPLGYEVYRMLDEYCATIFDERHYLINKFDYNFHNAGFSFQKFASLNPYSKVKAQLDLGKKEQAMTQQV